MAKCEYRYDGKIHTAETKKACAKLKVGYQKYLKDNNMDNAESRLKRNRSLVRGDDFQETKKKKKTSKVVSSITNAIKARKIRRQNKRKSKRTYNPYD